MILTLLHIGAKGIRWAVQSALRTVLCFSLQLERGFLTYTHTYIYICVCVCMCGFKAKASSLAGEVATRALTKRRGMIHGESFQIYIRCLFFSFLLISLVVIIIFLNQLWFVRFLAIGCPI